MASTAGKAVAVVNPKRDAIKRAAAIFFLAFVFGLFVLDGYFSKGSGFVRDGSGKYAFFGSLILATVSATIAFFLKLRG